MAEASDSECGGHIDLNLSASAVHTIQVRLWWWFRSGPIHVELNEITGRFARILTTRFPSVQGCGGWVCIDITH